MKNLLTFLTALVLFLTFDVAQTFATHLCGTDCNQFTDASRQACSHGCNVPGAAPNPDYNYGESAHNTSQEEQQAQIVANSQEIIEQAIANGASAATAQSVVASYIGQDAAAAALAAVNTSNTQAANVTQGCQGAGCCLGAWNCTDGNTYCAGADPGNNQYGFCVSGENQDRSGVEIAEAYIAAGGPEVAQNVINNPSAFLGNNDTGNTNNALLAIMNVGQQVLAQQNGGGTTNNESSEEVPENIDCNIDARRCGGNCRYACGGPESGVWFCGDTLALRADDPLNCSDQILLYGGRVLYAMSGDQCPAGYDSYGGYPLDCVAPAAFGWNGTTGCFEQDGANAYSLNQCSDPSQYAGGSACNNPVSTLNCIDSSACGLQQLDVCQFITVGTVTTLQCAYISVFTDTESCEPDVPAVIPPTITFNPPPVLPPPPGSTPPPSLPPQSPPPPGSPICVGLTSSIAVPTLGSAPVFTCTPAQQATRYEFRWKLGSGIFQTLTPNAANSNVSSPLTVNASGVHTIQCRPCNGSGCANWNNLSAVGQMCGGIAGILCPDGYTCEMGASHPDASGVCALEQSR